VSLVDVTIIGLGARGDGVATHDGKRLFVAFALPGERVRVRLLGPRGDGLASELVEVLAPSPARVTPKCPHFGRCGGCAAQHLDEPAYHAWKRDIVAQALARRGLDANLVKPPLRTPPGARRRARFTALKRGGTLTLGFHERASHRIVAVGPCPVLAPEIVALLPRLSTLMHELMDGKQAEIAVTRTDGGLDLLIEGGGELSLKRCTRLAAFAEAAALARIAWAAAGGTPETVVERRPAIVTIDGAAVPLPPGGFLQPSAEGAAALTAAVLAGVGTARRVADLFAGCGTFSLPLARGAQVRAVESDRAMAQALEHASRHMTGRKPIAVEVRDLDRRPLLPAELKGIDAVVFDPPYAGAEPQAAMLAKSAVPTIVGVSCNPATFARDARLLVDGGYRLESVQPVDQFLWSAEIELVAVFRRN
jgi:23S rRNA (uracil1939-C5)-methyltransferase